MSRRAPQLCIATVIALSAAAAYAQGSYPAKPVRIIVASSAGGPYDDVARALAPRLTEAWGQTVIVENRPGAGGIIGATAAAKSPADGYTWFIANAASIAINPSLRSDLPYQPQRDFTPVMLMMQSPMLLVVHPSLPARTVKDLVALAKAKPGRINYASAGVGNLQHLSMEYLQSIAGMRMNHVPYKGAAPALVDVIAGQVDLMFANIIGAAPHTKAQRLRPVAVSSAQRSPLMPDVPPVAESYPGFDVTAWMGWFGPTGTPRDVIEKVSRDLSQALTRADMRERFAQQGADVIAGSSRDLTERVRRETLLYGKLIEAAGIRSHE